MKKKATKLPTEQQEEKRNTKVLKKVCTELDNLRSFTTNRLEVSEKEHTKLYVNLLDSVNGQFKRITDQFSKLPDNAKAIERLDSRINVYCRSAEIKAIEFNDALAERDKIISILTERINGLTAKLSSDRMKLATLDECFEHLTVEVKKNTKLLNRTLFQRIFKRS